ncbi:MAG TPA: carboxylating nicotinate-nucleotide diphosphorylase [bacterium]|nr:carboxylating nicotinate-nucleotide diphosphorylase [bacterium]
MVRLTMLPDALIQTAASAALAEDAPWGDLTSDGLLPMGTTARLAIQAKSPGILCGLSLAEAVFRTVDPEALWEQSLADGAELAPGSVAATISGEARLLLRGERVALNFLQRLSGVATLTSAYVARAREGSPTARIVDTRKTTPGLRALEKYAVRMGGGQNHRFGLSDGILVKDNHLAVLARTGIPLEQGLLHLRRSAPYLCPVLVEVESLAQAEAAIAAGADALLLDNMSTDELRATVARVRELSGGRVTTEASGNMSLERVAEVAATGVDFISVGALTHSAPALDLSLDFVV